jgi:hypothetical protein
MARFYRTQIEAGAIAFPYRYFLLSAEEAALRDRRAADRATTGRRRGGFETHLEFIEPQWRFFRAMQELNPDRVEFLPEDTVENTVDRIARSITERPPTPSEDRSLVLFDQMAGWIQRQSAT